MARDTRHGFRFLALVAALLLVAPLFTARASGAQSDVELTVLTHWGEQHVTEAIEPQLQACAEQTGVQVEHQTVEFGELLNRITTGRLGGQAPDS